MDRAQPKTARAPRPFAGPPDEGGEERPGGTPGGPAPAAAEGHPRAGVRRPEPGKLPSLAQQKSFIVDNVAVLNRETKISILSIVMMEIGTSAPGEAGPGEAAPAHSRPVMYESGGREVDVDLDAVGAINPEVLTHIYNIVHARREQLSQPARQ